MYSIRLVTADSYQAAPIPDVDPTFSHFRGSEIKQVPIVRIFGITDKGEKVCLHVHGAFPYLYVPYTGKIKADILMYRLASSLDAAINVSLGAAKSNTQHVYKIQEVSAIPLYGYYRKGHHFFKIYFYNPAMHKRAIELLQSGSVIDQTFQPYEAHIPFILQFMIDYNIYGMSMINLKNVKHRHQTTVSQNERKSSHNSDEIVDFDEKEYLPFSVSRQSVCKLEIDVCASDILNREVIDKGIDLNPGIAAIWDEERTRRAQADLGGESQLTYPESPARSQGSKIQTDNDVYYQRRFLQRLASLESQADETALTPSSDSSSYPIPVPHNSNLLNASQLEIHTGPAETSIAPRFMNQQHLSDNLSLSLESQASFNNVSLDTSDLDVVNILANLAENQEGNRNEIDSDSILGSQVSQQDFPLEPDQDAYNEEEEEVPDLNLTNLELDNLNFSAWDVSQFNPEKSQHQTQKSTGSQIELVLESLDNPGPSSSTGNIPQLDGPIDDENARPGPSEDPDVTIARQEFLECDYRRSRGGRRSVSVTPKKRKRVTSSEDDDSRSPTKKRTKNQLPRTPRRSPNKRTSKLTSPGCPTRTYSPLSLEISGGQRTPKTPVASPYTSPSASRSDRQKLRESFRRKAIFSPVKESNKEDEHVSVESVSTKTPSKALKELFTPKKDRCEDKVPDSDDTLVEDSEESDGTLTSSPPPKPVIIDDSDSNPTHSQEKLSSLSNYNFPHGTLHPLPEEQEDEPVLPLEKSYSQIPGTGHKTLNDELQTSFFAQVNRGGAKAKSPAPNRQQVLENMERCGLLNKDDANDSENSEPGERIDDLTRQFFNQLHEAGHKTLDEEVQSSFFAQMNCDGMKTFPPPPSKEQILEHIEKFGLLNEDEDNDTDNSEPGQIDDFTKQFFSKLREMRQRELDDEGQLSSLARINSDGLIRGTPHPGRQQDLDNVKESLNLLKSDDSHNGVEEKVNKPVELSSSQIRGATRNEQDNKAQTSSATHERPEGSNRSKMNPPNMQGFFKSTHDDESPNRENTEPFFSNPDDTVGLPARYQTTVRPRLDNWHTPNVLKLPFSSDDLAKMGLGVCYKDDKTVTITPLILPPSREEVMARWKERNEAKKAEKEEEEKKKKDMDLQRGFSQRSEVSSDSSTIVDQSLSISKLFKDNNHASDGSKHLGISCGDIEGPSRSTIVPADGNIGAKALASHQFLTIFCLEVHVITRPGLLPDPQFDPIAAIFYAIYNDVPPDWNNMKTLDCGVIIVDRKRVNPKPLNLNGINPDEQTLSYVATEEESFDKLLSIVESCDPEMLIGWDIDVQSWGYLFQRASHLGKNLSGKISRIPATKNTWEQQRGDPSAPETRIETLAEVRLPGRIVLEVWRIMKYEIAAYSYTYENVMYNVMNERVPRVSFDTLTQWWKSPLSQWRVIDNYANRVIGIHRLLHHFDIINRTSEHARLYGVQFLEVFSRGSQFRVESMMLRIAKPLNYIPCSPSPQQRASMRAPESLPLIMEPESTMYVDPVIVLDFQSLYPSIIIAYNYCFSTCLGRVEHIGAPYPFEFGCTTLKVPKNLALKLQDKVNFAPCGVAYVKQEVRQGILPRMLTEILNTRFMVKKAIKDHPKDDRALQRALHSRQLGLKLIANVTYGYTAANFSGRMPCIEVGDSVVSKGKETLERAIKIVESTPKWGARVIYGDTDSLFILVKGKSREEAFKIGADIADTVTAANPKPVKLKFEKVLQPCILQTKKRYCGYMYENLNDKPVYLAKGIETVRRDGCPAVAKILEKSLKILFETKDLSEVKQYVTRQLDKVLSGRASIQDLTFAKEFRGLRGYKAAACVPALELTKRMVQKDPRAVPRTGSRVPYIIVAGGPNEPLIRCVRSPMEVLMDPSLRPNATYYITKVIIPPLNRCLNLIGVDAYAWFMTMPHRQAAQRVQGAMMANSNRKQKTTISQYLCNISCPCCGQACDRGICNECIKNKTATLINLHEKCRQYERIYSNIKMICESCIGVKDADSCISLDCPMFYRRIYAQRDNSQVSHLYDLINCMEHLT